MHLQPATIQELQKAVAAASAGRNPIGGIDLSALGRVLEHHPEDMTVTAEAGLTLAKLQEALKAGHQWLPIDPPFPERTTIRELLARNLSGPRRFGYGTIREYLIGISVVLADGRLVKSGGKVVKNVAGYDLLKLFVGDHGSLGVIVEATFKVLPLPAREEVLQRPYASGLVPRIIASPITPVVLDVHNQDLILAFAGVAEDVDWQMKEVAALADFTPSTLGYHREFWSRSPAARKLSVLPSRLPQAFEQYRPEDFVAHAGNGVLYYRGGKEPPKAEAPLALARRLKDTFDPHHILPELPL